MGSDEDDYLFLQKLDVEADGKLAGVLSRNGAASLTVCPRCRIDDFTHVEGCPLGQAGNREADAARNAG